MSSDAPPVAAHAPAAVAPLTRPRDCAVAGVAAGLARHLGVPVLPVRVVFAATTFVFGAGALLYLWLWAFTPWDEPVAADDPAPGAAPSRTVPVARILVAAAALALLAAVVVAVAEWGARWPLDAGKPQWARTAGLGIALAVAAAAWSGFIDRVDPRRGPRSDRATRAAVVVLLAVTVIVPPLSPWASVQPAPAFLVSLAAAVGIALVFAPRLVAQWRELVDARTRRIRDEQRSEMAAHLHDSVLQTLALIQHRAGASSEVARLARAQERELREWLHAGDSPADSDLGTDLRDFAAALELDYPVTVDVVVVGASAERASGELAAAAREAMLNAARHAGGEVSVYVEGTAHRVEVFVRDRGPGFDPAAVPVDRLGVRESIIGRMRRAGGRAEVRAGAGGTGTEVHLVFEAPQPAPSSPQQGEAARG
ncbi:ATP-binding protein [Agromyces mangrovi Wang et al. 2018]|uniref:ATP-binding protein n=1 Tax=Agromyces mangrovi TaxID=1858653 RepID=UPI002572E396|nr:ATP-binding protein [Agromyces mangrovi]BDZ65121.1 putative two-component system sensor kinase [Agromyces mangrovi]